MWDMNLPIGAPPERTFLGHTDRVMCVGHVQETVAFSGGNDKIIKVWDIRTGECVRNMEGHTEFVSCIDTATDLVISGAYDGTVRIWNSETGQQEGCMKVHSFVLKFKRAPPRILIISS
jgi:WD40 repeat protein